MRRGLAVDSLLTWPQVTVARLAVLQATGMSFESLHAPGPAVTAGVTLTVTVTPAVQSRRGWYYY